MKCYYYFCFTDEETCSQRNWEVVFITCFFKFLLFDKKTETLKYRRLIVRAPTFKMPPGKQKCVSTGTKYKIISKQGLHRSRSYLQKNAARPPTNPKPVGLALHFGLLLTILIFLSFGQQSLQFSMSTMAYSQTFPPRY